MDTEEVKEQAEEAIEEAQEHEHEIDTTPKKPRFVVGAEVIVFTDDEGKTLFRIKSINLRKGELRLKVVR